MQALLIVALSIAAAVVYGVAHDQVTVRVCLEYFTVFHPRVIESQDPTTLALVWGVIATWWVGLPLGCLLAVAARAGSRPPLAARDLVRPVAGLLAVMGACALLAGVIGWLLARGGAVWVSPGLAERIRAERHHAFLADLWSHNASYIVGGIGGIVLAVRTWMRRRAR